MINSTALAPKRLRLSYLTHIIKTLNLYSCTCTVISFCTKLFEIESLYDYNLSLCFLICFIFKINCLFLLIFSRCRIFCFWMSLLVLDSSPCWNPGPLWPQCALSRPTDHFSLVLSITVTLSSSSHSSLSKKGMERGGWY